MGRGVAERAAAGRRGVATMTFAWLAAAFIRWPSAVVRLFDRFLIGGTFDVLAGVFLLAGRMVSGTRRQPVQRHLFWLAAVLFLTLAVWLWSGLAGVPGGAAKGVGQAW